MALLVPLCFRSSYQSMLRRITNFRNGALVGDSANWGRTPIPPLGIEWLEEGFEARKACLEGPYTANV
jgi:hypothetical protein